MTNFWRNGTRLVWDTSCSTWLHRTSLHSNNKHTHLLMKPNVQNTLAATTTTTAATTLAFTDYCPERFFWATRFFVSMPCTRLSWPSRKLLSAHLSTVSYHHHGHRRRRYQLPPPPLFPFNGHFPGKSGSAGTHQVPEGNLWGVVEQGFLWAGRPYQPTISVKALKRK